MAPGGYNLQTYEESSLGPLKFTRTGFKDYKATIGPVTLVDIRDNYIPRNAENNIGTGLAALLVLYTVGKGIGLLISSRKKERIEKKALE